MQRYENFLIFQTIYEKKCKKICIYEFFFVTLQPICAYCVSAHRHIRANTCVRTKKNMTYNELMYQTAYLERWGTGVARILEICKEYGVPEPEWTIT